MMIETLVLDLKKTHSHLVDRMIRSVQQLSLKPDWHSHAEAFRSGGTFWHFNHSPPIREGRVLSSVGNNARPRVSVTSVLDQPGYEAWRDLWLALSRGFEVSGRAQEFELVRVYLNAYMYGTDAAIHTDSSEPDEITAVIAVHSHWDRNWGGETVVFDENEEPMRAVLPMPGRAFVFRSSMKHVARPLARACTEIRKMLVFKFASWPVHVPVAAGGVDALFQSMPCLAPPGFEGMKVRSDEQRYAMAVQWLGGSKAAHIVHGRGSLAMHLVSVATWLRMWGEPHDVVMAGMCHSIFSTQTFRKKFLDSIRDRSLAESVFGVEAVALAVAFASCDRSKLAKLRESVMMGAEIQEFVELVRSEKGVEGPEYGSMQIDRDALTALWKIEAANMLSQMDDLAAVAENPLSSGDFGVDAKPGKRGDVVAIVNAE